MTEATWTDGALGVVPTDGRGSMPFILLHGESLVAVASWAVGHADVELLDFNASWDDVVARELPLLVHDPLCAGAPADFLARAVAHAASTRSVVVGMLGEQVASPVVLPAAVVATLDDWPDLTDLPRWVAQLRERFPLQELAAPEQARRLTGSDDVPALEALTAAAEPRGHVVP